MPDPAGKPLAGEIYIVDGDTLARLDQLEREGTSYDRKLIDVSLRLAGGERLPTKAFIYVNKRPRLTPRRQVQGAADPRRRRLSDRI
jgi:gamma-glutamylcyclotransferase (GGCT)/AIG2-like uncharacterized protein YtfP